MPATLTDRLPPTAASRRHLLPRLSLPFVAWAIVVSAATASFGLHVDREAELDGAGLVIADPAALLLPAATDVREAARSRR